MKIAYIAHPISHNVQGNIQKVLDIVRQINLTEPNVVPFAPYITDLQVLNDSVKAERARGIKNNMAYFEKGVIDELRLYGDRISPGMRGEIKMAQKYGIPVIQMTESTEN